MDELDHAYNSSVTILDVAWKTCQNQWTTGRGGKRGSEISVLIARHGYDDLLSNSIALTICNQKYE